MASLQIYAYAAIVAVIAVFAAHRVALVVAAVLTKYEAPGAKYVPPSYKFRGNNGTVSGTTYCAGGWEGSGGNKGMVCVDGVNAATGAHVPCDAVVGLGPSLAYDCRLPNYPGNNGTVSGSTYCTGGWGSSSAKNMKCHGGIDANGNPIGCAAMGTAGSWFCQH